MYTKKTRDKQVQSGRFIPYVLQSACVTHLKVNIYILIIVINNYFSDVYHASILVNLHWSICAMQMFEMFK